MTRRGLFGLLGKISAAGAVAAAVKPEKPETKPDPTPMQAGFEYCIIPTGSSSFVYYPYLHFQTMTVSRA